MKGWEDVELRKGVQKDDLVFCLRRSMKKIKERCGGKTCGGGGDKIVKGWKEV